VLGSNQRRLSRRFYRAPALSSRDLACARQRNGSSAAGGDAQVRRAGRQILVLLLRPRRWRRSHRSDGAAAPVRGHLTACLIHPSGHAVCATRGFHTCPVSTTEHIMSTHWSTVDSQGILNNLNVQVKGGLRSGPPGDRTRNPRIKSPYRPRTRGGAPHGIRVLRGWIASSSHARDARPFRLSGVPGRLGRSRTHGGAPHTRSPSRRRTRRPVRAGVLPAPG
jgi:hypothetical protein